MRVDQDPRSILHWPKGRVRSSLVDINDSPVTSETGDLGYDDNPHKGFGTDP